MNIAGILDEKNEFSPMNTILKTLKLFECGKSDKNILTKTQRNLCLLADIIKVFLRDQFKYLQNNYTDLEKQDNLLERIHFYLESIKRLRQKMEWIVNKFSILQIPKELHEAFQFADEYISLQIEKWITKCLEFFEDKLPQESKNSMSAIIEKELEHRENLKSLLIIRENDTNETYSYQEGILKKYVQSVLYLEKKKKDPRSHSLEIFYSVAAGIAMFFSLFLGFLILSYFTMYSIPFIIATVVIYMLKDRIKENIRGISQKAVGSLFPDQRIDIVDGFNKEKIGKCKEIVNFINIDKIPSEVLRIRQSSNISSIEGKGKPEKVIVYKKKITLYNKKIKQFHKRRKDISDVIRFNIRGFLRYADDSVQFLSKWNLEKKKIEKIPVSKVYHINLVLRLIAFKGKKIDNVHYKKFRVIIDQNGIKRVLQPEFSL